MTFDCVIEFPELSAVTPGAGKFWAKKFHFGVRGFQEENMTPENWIDLPPVSVRLVMECDPHSQDMARRSKIDH